MATLTEVVHGVRAAGIDIRPVVAAGSDAAHVQDVVMGDLPAATVPASRGSLVLLPGEAVSGDPLPMLCALLDRGTAGVVVRGAADAAARAESVAPPGLAILSVPAGTRWCDLVAAIEAVHLGTADPSVLLREWLLSIALGGAGAHPFLEQLRCFFEAPVAFVDRSLRVVDCSGRVRYRTLLGRTESTLLRTAPPLGGGFRISDPPGTISLEPIDHQGHRMGYLAVSCTRQPRPYEAVVLRHAASVYGWQCYVEARSISWRRQGKGQTITRMLVDRTAGPRDARTWATALGVFLDVWQVALAVLLPTGVSLHAAGGAIERAAAREGVRVFWDGLSEPLCAAVLDLPAGGGGPAAEGVAQRVAVDVTRKLRAQGTVTIGIGAPVHGAENLAESFAQARRLAELGRRMKGDGVYRAEDLGPMGLLTLAAPGPLRALARRIVGRLDAEDEAGAPQLRATLRAFLDADGDRRRAADVLHVHPNTVSYRLQRIGGVTGLDPLRLGDLLQLQLALLASELPDEP